MKFYLKETVKYLLRSRPLIRREIKEVERLYAMNTEELQRYKEERFLALFRHAITQSAFYKEFYTDAGISINDIQSLQDIKKLPILTKESVRKHAKEILTVPRWKMFKANTSGTTGTPLTVYQSYKAIKRHQAYIFTRRKQYGVQEGDRLVSLRAYMENDRFRRYIHLSNTLFLSSYRINTNNTDNYFEEINKFQPKTILGHPSSLYNLCLLFRKQKLTLNIPIAITSSETLYDFQRKVIEKTLNTKIYDLYGCTEKGIRLTQKISGVGYVEEPGYSINEYQDDYILTTSLINDHFPLIRYKVNDKIEFAHQEDGETIRSILGRTEDTIICRDGTTVGRTDDLLATAKNILLAQIVQKEPGKIDLNIVPDVNFSEENEKQILKNLYSKMAQDNMNVTINRITEENIIYSGRNKFRFVVSVGENKV